MSDFFNSGWSVFIAVVTVLSLVACLALLVIASRRRVMADDNTTGHVWDEDVRELNNPLPRWWMWLFVITVVFSAIYLALYPGLGSLTGTLKWSSMGQFEAEQAKARETIAPIYAKYASMPAEQLAKTPEAMAIGERLYLNNCSQCHGSDARGSKGFPDLTDGDWLGGSGTDYIAKTIAEGRQGAMPPMAAAIGTGDDVRNVANYVLSLSGSPHDNVAAQLGKAKFAACAACHGPDGKGNQAIGAPNLTDKVWLHGWGEQAIVGMINSGKTNVMPPQGRLLTPDQVHVLAAYVWNLSQSPRASASN
ncbi:MAG: cytochrome-c oxidase, cbb3-type subunit III [Burkholderiales bacterium]|nr:MAG: cytochrome-c oxidase, cbb3-type subunit III [Burkholderiales bacterium]